jgi:hypothetical protein
MHSELEDLFYMTPSAHEMTEKVLILSMGIRVSTLDLRKMSWSKLRILQYWGMSKATS